jgi:hypothetical protein
MVTLIVIAAVALAGLVAPALLLTLFLGQIWNADGRKTRARAELDGPVSVAPISQHA